MGPVPSQQRRAIFDRLTPILVLFAHPAFERSRVHRRLVDAVAELPGITFHDLYEAYPDFDVDVRREQKLLLEHDLVVLQHPFFWYSTPPLVKQWEDLVLEHGWAYGTGGNALHGKRLLGRRAFQAERAARTFRRHDEDALDELRAARGDRETYLGVARRRIADLERTLLADLTEEKETDAGWDAETLRADVLSRPAPPSDDNAPEPSKS